MWLPGSSHTKALIAIFHWTIRLVCYLAHAYQLPNQFKKVLDLHFWQSRDAIKLKVSVSSKLVQFDSLNQDRGNYILVCNIIISFMECLVSLIRHLMTVMSLAGSPSSTFAATIPTTDWHEDYINSYISATKSDCAHIKIET